MLIFLMFVFILVSLLMILIVLIQKGRGGGLSSAFGGGGAGQAAFGAKTGDVLTWATSIIFGIFMLLAIGLNLMVQAQIAPTPEAEERAPIQDTTSQAPPPGTEEPVEPGEGALPAQRPAPDAPAE